MSGAGEILGLISGAINLASLAGEIGNGIIKLRGMVRDVSDAPEALKRLLSELKVLHTIIEHLANKYTELTPSLLDETTKNALILVSASVKKLNSRLNQLDIDPGGSRRKLLWQKLRYVLTKEELRDMLGELERGKTVLLQCQLCSTNGAALAAFEAHAASSHRLEVQLDNLSLSQGEVLSHTADTRRRTQIIQDETAKISDTVQLLLESSQLTNIANILQPVLKQLIQEEIRAEMQHWSETWTTKLQNQDETDEKKLADQNQNAFRFASTCAASPSPYRNPTSQMALDTHSSASERWFNKTRTRVINLLFGRIQFRTRIMDGHDDETTTLELDCKLLPAPWLLNRGILLAIRHVTSKAVSPSIGICLTPVIYLKPDSPFVLAIANGQLDCAEKMVSSGEVSPHAYSLTVQTSCNFSWIKLWLGRSPLIREIAHQAAQNGSGGEGVETWQHG